MNKTVIKNKVYLGDSVYAQPDGFSIILTTENGFGASNTIVLEPEVLEALIKYKQHLSHTAELNPL